MPQPFAVSLGPQPISRYAQILGDEFGRVEAVAEEAADHLAGRVVWNVNSTALGGGVAEMIRAYLPYVLDGGIDARWLVLQEDPAFFVLTKRIHNNLHGKPGDEGPLGKREQRYYSDALAESERALTGLISAGDVVILHDPQTAGLVPAIKEHGATVIWRCHVGTDEENHLTRRAEDFLAGFVQTADASVFSRAEYVFDELPDGHSTVIPPGIDAFTSKNEEVEPKLRDAVNVCIGLARGDRGQAPVFRRSDGGRGEIRASAQVIHEAPLNDETPLIAQVSRWDRLKDHAGVLEMFARHLENPEAHLALVGPDCTSVDDDPEGSRVFAEVLAAYMELPKGIRSRVHIVSLPQQNLEESAFMVNAIQRRADVIVQKSIAEGFGLTVTEGMWKSRPLVASRVGGIQDQIENGRSGTLIEDPADLESFAEAVDELLVDEDRVSSFGEAGHERIRSGFLAVQRLTDHYGLIASVATD